MSYLMQRRRELMMSQPSVVNKELVFSYECQLPLLVPVSYDSTNLIIEVENCPSTVSDSNASYVLPVPLNGATSGLPRRAFSIKRVDSTHVQIINNDSYSFGGTLDFDNFVLAIREAYTSQDSLDSLLSDVCDYEVEADGLVQISEKCVFRFFVGGWQSISPISNNQSSTLVNNGVTSLCKSVLNIDLSNKTIVVKSSDVRYSYVNNGAATYYDEHFNDETTVTFTANPNRFAISGYLLSGVKIKIYKIL